ncbi:alanine racemase [Echinicola marina]|uniref:alanine racemase n=1 Tax=Echinicola marina TaxID=2859768 RepID=UPI001CF6183A|nr:alanine racemase [Echinicola marina]UCS91564.1 alanine racemase [Echinicola marina]
MTFLSIKQPILVLNETICRKNLSKMAEKAKKHQLNLVPHFKTHQSLKVGEWCRDFGVKEITVSSLKMAQYFSQQAWDNIHIAFPFNPLLTAELNQLAQSQSISIQLVNEEVCLILAAAIDHPIGYFIEIDAGYGRTGVEVSDFGLIEKIMRVASKNKNMFFKGFYIHAGHSYHADLDGIKHIHEQTRAALKMLKDKYHSEFPHLLTRSGDTPCCSIMDNFEGIDEIGPGNFVFYDLTQAKIGSCLKEDIAVALAVPVVDIHWDKKEVLVHGGGVHLAKDELINADGSKNYGEVVLFKDRHWQLQGHPSYIKSISQEHGIIKASDQLIRNIKIGDVIGILPVHSCMTADCMGSYISTEGEIIDHLEGHSKK